MTQWLDDQEGAAWQAYVVSSLFLFGELEHGLLDAGDINHLDYGILAQLSFRDSKSERMAELADVFGESRTLVSYRIRRLEDRGFVRRERDPEDGRGVRAVLTAQGVAILAELATGHVARVRQHFLDHVTDEELPVLVALFERVRAAQLRKRGSEGVAE